MMISSIATRLFPALSVLTLVAGCGHVAANYPDQRPPTSALPLEYTSRRGEAGVLVWQDPGRAHGFVTAFESASDRAAFYHGWGDRTGNPVFRRAADIYRGLADEGLAEIALYVFFRKGVSLPCDEGDFEITFEDGAVVRDRGVIRAEPRDVDKPFRWTRDGRIVLSREPVGGSDDPLRTTFLVPEEHLGKAVAKLDYRRGK